MIEKDADGRITMFVRRALDTGDEKDFVFPLDQEFVMGYAYNDEKNTLGWYSKHKWAGSVMVTLPSNGSPVLGSLPQTETDEKGDDNENTVIKDDGTDYAKLVLGLIEQFV